MVILALTEPSVIHHKALDADACRFFGKRNLASLVYVKASRLPRVVEDGSQLWVGMARQDRVDFVSMHQPRRTTDAVVRVASIEVRRGELFARLQQITEVEGIRATGYSHLLELVLL